MFNLDDITSKNDNKGWPYRKLIIGPSGSVKKTIYLIQFKEIATLLKKFIYMQKT